MKPQTTLGSFESFLVTFLFNCLQGKCTDNDKKIRLDIRWKLKESQCAQDFVGVKVRHTKEN